MATCPCMCSSTEIASYVHLSLVEGFATGKQEGRETPPELSQIHDLLQEEYFSQVHEHSQMKSPRAHVVHHQTQIPWAAFLLGFQGCPYQLESWIAACALQQWSQFSPEHE